MEPQAGRQRACWLGPTGTMPGTMPGKWGWASGGGVSLLLLLSEKQKTFPSTMSCMRIISNGLMEAFGFLKNYFWEKKSLGDVIELPRQWIFWDFSLFRWRQWVKIYLIQTSSKSCSLIEL